VVRQGAAQSTGPPVLQAAETKFSTNAKFDPFCEINCANFYHNKLEIREEVLPKGPEARAVRYALNQWEALNRFLKDGDLESTMAPPSGPAGA
jgi:hypothetical protein